MKKADFVYEIDEHETFFYSQLSERGKRQYAGLEAMKIGYNGVEIVSRRLDIHKHTVRKGKKELLTKTVLPTNKIRQKGGGRKKNSCCKGIDWNPVTRSFLFYCRQSNGLQCFMDKSDIMSNSAKIEIAKDFRELSRDKEVAEKL